MSVGSGLQYLEYYCSSVSFQPTPPWRLKFEERKVRERVWIFCNFGEANPNLEQSLFWFFKTIKIIKLALRSAP